jgi:tetraacyldisaccharide 4'-kinase
VVSVGNLSVGGSGKTPLTIRLAELLSADEFAVDVLSRGYGRASRAVERVDPAGNALRFGDEPLLIARRTGVPVFVGGSRFAAGLVAEEIAAAAPDPMSQNRDMGHPGVLRSREPGSEDSISHVHLLDDGFQHLQLARDVDVVVLHRSDFAEKLLPTGRLREPLTALRRADFVVLREEDSDLEAEIRRLGIEAPVWWMRRSLEIPEELKGTTERVVAFCGIARPEEFFSSLIAAGVNLEETVEFVDHHRFTSDGMGRLAGVAKKVDAQAFVITEKDSVKLDAPLLAILEAFAPVHVAKLAVSLRDEVEAVRRLRDKLVTARSAALA